jgi:hypothetical protein
VFAFLAERSLADLRFESSFFCGSKCIILNEKLKVKVLSETLHRYLGKRHPVRMEWCRRTDTRTARSWPAMDERDRIEQVKTMPDDELRDTRRDLQTGIGLLRPRSPRYAPARAYLAAVTAELAGRAAARPDGLPGSPRPDDPGGSRTAG